MGIPKYFKNITSNNPELIKQIEDINYIIDNLYLDLNCLIHPCCKKAESEYQSLLKIYNNQRTTTRYLKDIHFITEFELKIYQLIEFYMNNIINYIKPKKSVFIAIDGVAPRSKMEQQRLRRYKSVLINDMKKKILKNYNINTETFDSNCITPGTLFMLKLSNFLKKFIDNYHDSNITFYLSDSSILGEGEHKILQHIKKYNQDNVNCIYGLDADLIMLSLVSGSKIYLVREDVHFNKVNMDSLLLFDVEMFSDLLFTYITSMIHIEVNENPIEEISKEFLIKDYICLCFFIGNDFLPHIEGFDINTGSINSLIDIYCKLFSIRNKYLVNEDNSLNFVFVRQILTYLFNHENIYIKNYQKRIDHFKPRIDNSNNKMDIELQELNFYPIFNKNNYLKLGYDDWIDKYYNYYFNITNSIKDNDYINTICCNYIEGLQWNSRYYFDQCISYSWYYKYNAAPLLKDLCICLTERIYPCDFSDIRFSPLEQLSIVLPFHCNDLWCNDFKTKVKDTIELQQYYPSNYQLDTLNKKFLHECEPILPNIDAIKIKEIFKNIKLTSIEKILNENKGELYISQHNNIKLLIK